MRMIYEQSSWIWDNKLTFAEVYPTAEKFKTLINGLSEVAPSFSLDVLYLALTRIYKYDKIKHTSKYAFDNDIGIIWNNNIYKWNRVYNLLNQDYTHESGKIQTLNDTTTDETDRTKQDIVDIDNVGSVEQISFDKPQFTSVESNPNNKAISDTTENQDSQQDTTEDIDRTIIKSMTNKNQEINENKQIEEYLAIYRRFTFQSIAKAFEDLFVNLLI